jgi:hypothetical protein
MNSDELSTATNKESIGGRMRSGTLMSLAFGLALILTAGAGTAWADGPPRWDRTEHKEIYIPGENESTEYVKGELIVKLSADDSLSIEQINDAYGTTITAGLPELRIYLLGTADGANPESLAVQIASMPNVIYAQANYRVDPLQSVQGSYPISDLTGKGSFSDQPPAQELQLGVVHRSAQGGGVTVGIIDGGIDYTHPVFEGHAFSGYDYVDDDSDAMDELGGDNTGHGTFVAGVVHLVAPDADLVAYRASSVDGHSDGFVVAKAILRAVDDGCNVINLSMVVMEEHYAVTDAIQYAVDAGTIVVAAAGNGTDSIPKFPASDPNVIAVAAVDSVDRLADFSSYGDYIDVSAPGAYIYAPFQDHGYAWWSGTSFAAPFITGQAALVLSRKPTASRTAVINSILSTTKNIADKNPNHIDAIGSGRSNPLGSLGAIESSDSTSITPDTLVFEAEEGAEYFAAFTGMAFLTSENSPAAYSAEVAGGLPLFTTLVNEAGTTPDSVFVLVDPSLLEAGTYYNTVLCTIEGIDLPVALTVRLDVTAAGGSGASASLMPGDVSVTSEYDNPMVQTGCVFLNSTNAPVTYFAEPGRFSMPVDTVGTTPDTVCVNVYPGNLTPGIYYDTVTYHVDGVSQPAYLHIQLTVQDNTNEATAAVFPDSIYMEKTFGDETVDTVYAVVTSSNAPAAYTVSTGDFFSLVDINGFTNDTIGVVIDPARFSIPGLFWDTVTFQVEGVPQPVYLDVALRLRRVTDSARFQPSLLQFNTTAGSTQSQTRCAVLSSLIDPAPYTGQLQGGSFASASKTSGTTEDSICFTVDPTGLGPGLYIDTAVYSVEGISYPAILEIQMWVGDTASDSTLLLPSSFSYSVPAGSEEVFYDCAFLHSSNAPASYSGQVLGGGSFTTLLDTLGTTDDSVCFMVNPAGLTPGVYCDTLVYSVDGIAQPAAATICLSVDTLGDTSGNPYDSAYVIPSVINVATGSTSGAPVIIRCAMLMTTGSAAPYVAVPGSFTEPVDSSGIAPDSVCVRINADTLSLGVHCDTIRYYVSGIANPATLIVCVDMQTSSSEPQTQPVEQTQLSNYPNPFNPKTTISFNLGAPSQVRLTVYNVLGQEVATLIDEYLGAGEHIVDWDGTSQGGSSVGSGVYFYRLETENTAITKKMLLLK